MTSVRIKMIFFTVILFILLPKNSFKTPRSFFPKIVIQVVIYNFHIIVKIKKFWVWFTLQAIPGSFRNIRVQNAQKLFIEKFIPLQAQNTTSSSKI